MRTKPAVSTQSVKVPAAPRARRYRTVRMGRPDQRQLSRLFPKTVSACLPLGTELACRAPLAPESPAAARRKKSVSFAEEKNVTHLVRNWIDPLFHQHHTHRGHVRFYGLVYEQPVSRWIEPDGCGQLHFPRTIWPRDTPSTTDEDDDGDVVMLDG